MTDQIKCPNCGSVDNEECQNVHGCHLGCGLNLSDRVCNKCWASWNEKNRQPPEITPRMTWDAFCKRHFEVFPYLESISVNDNIITGNITFNYKTHSVDLFGALPYTMGWQDMPERKRDNE